MKKLIIFIIFGFFLGLLFSGIYWSNKYIKLYGRYNNAVELLRLYND